MVFGHDLGDMGRGLGVGRNAPVFLDGLGAGIVGGERQFEAAEPGELRQEVPRPALEVLDRVMRIDTQDTRGFRHQLRKPDGPGPAHGLLPVSALDADHSLEEDGPVVGRQPCPCEARMALMPRGNLADKGDAGPLPR